MDSPFFNTRSPFSSGFVWNFLGFFANWDALVTAHPEGGVTPVDSLAVTESYQPILHPFKRTGWKRFNSSGLWVNFDPIRHFTDEFSLLDPTDPTKIGQFGVSGISALTTRVLQFPDKNGTIATLSDLPVYGTQYNRAYDASVSTTLSDTFQSKLSLANAGLPAGDYIVKVSYMWNHNANTSDFEAQLLFDTGGPASRLYFHKAEPKDNGGNDPPGTGSAQNYPSTKLIPLTLAAGEANFELQFRTDDIVAESSIWESLIEFYRVA